MTSRTLRFTASSLPAVSISNPVSPPRTHEATPAPVTKTIPRCTIYHTHQADLAPLMAGIQTQEQLDDLRESLARVQCQGAAQSRLEQLRDPPMIAQKGRPSTQRLLGPTEGRPQGGGARIPMQRQQLPLRDLEQPLVSTQPAETQPAVKKPAASHPAPTQRRQNQCGLCRQLGHNSTSCPLRAT
ncbi:hypothetical protein FB451DRAFT_1059946 [Mycena latifolia]|nr:hypothetical protein FB451DRAFT_1059946 [Mycena latifolia]